MKKEKSDQNAVAELTREWLYKENKWLWEENKKLKAENKKLKEDVDFYYKSAKQFREQVEKWEKDFVEWRIVEKD